MYEDDEEIKPYPLWIRKLIWAGVFVVGSISISSLLCLIYLAIKVSL
tara:strand:+ start:1249 stop:1389 length:141 start_codon:yes stop_codon:yes gene_type:complete